MTETWFDVLFGTNEDVKGSRLGRSDRELFEQTKSKFKFDDRLLTAPNNREFDTGSFYAPSLGDLRESPMSLKGSLKLSCVKGDAGKLQAEVKNQYATFQVASQFNCLEMPAPSVTMYEGIGHYEIDETQGPVCSIGAGAALFVRNYFLGEIDTISRFFSKLDIWEWIGVENGYAGHNCSASDIENINEQLENVCADKAREELMVGVHYDVECTSTDMGRTVLYPTHKITQVFCSALAVGYNHNDFDKDQFAAISKLVLSATYEATLRVAVRNMEYHNAEKASSVVFLTLVGGGVFQNKLQWIVEGIKHAIYTMCDVPLDVRIVIFKGDAPEEIVAMIEEFSRFQKKRPSSDGLKFDPEGFLPVYTEDPFPNLNKKHRGL